MAKAPINTALGRQISGTMDDVVYRVVDGQTFLARLPREFTKPPTQLQLDNRRKFGQAGAYAAAVLDDPARKQPYVEIAQQEGISNRRLFGVIARDWYVPPTIDLIDRERYRRRVGDEIRITASDDLKVVAVKVKLTRQSDGVLIEEGPASYYGPHWRYVAKVEAPAGIPLVCEVIAEDLAGNASIERMGIMT